MSELLTAIARIRQMFAEKQTYEHRIYLPSIPETEKWRSYDVGRYAWFKHCVAAAIQPKTIVEIGVCWGVAGRAFLDACPGAAYIGHDSGLDSQKIFEWFPLTFHGFNAKIVSIDSVNIRELPACDLVHVDGGHSWVHAFQDTFHALRAAPWVLVDDCRDSQVAAAALQALYVVRPGDCEWAYFPETFGGDLLIYRG